MDTIHLWNRLGDTYRHLGDYEQAMAAFRNADGLALPAASTPDESVSTKPEAQHRSSEDLFMQPGLNSEGNSLHKQAWKPELGEPDMDDKDSLPGMPEPAYISWLDGLASVMTSFHRHEKYEAGEVNPATVAISDERDKDLELQFVQPEASYPAFTKDKSIQLVDADKASWYEPLPEYTDNQSAPDPVMLTYHEPPEAVQAETIGKRGPAIKEENAHLWNELGSIYMNTGAFPEAMNAFEKAIELDRSYGWSYNNLATLYSRQGRHKDAIALYQKGLKYLKDAKDKALLWNRLGDAYRRLDQHDRAASAYRKAMQLDPDNVSLLTRARFSLLGNCRA